MKRIPTVLSLLTVSSRAASAHAQVATGGAAWEFYGDTKLNATGFFKPPTREKPPLSRDQFTSTYDARQLQIGARVTF